MEIGSPFDALHGALASALHRDMPDVIYNDRDWKAWQKLTKEEQHEAIKNNTVPGVIKTRRPHASEVNVTMFPQGWGSTALGYGGIGGSAMTPAYTVIVHGAASFCVYFGGGRLAYRLDYNKMSAEGRERLRQDIAEQNMASVAESGRYK